MLYHRSIYPQPFVIKVTPVPHRPFRILSVCLVFQIQNRAVRIFERLYEMELRRDAGTKMETTIVTGPDAFIL